MSTALLVLVGLLSTPLSQAGTFFVNNTSGCTLALAIQSANLDSNISPCAEIGPDSPPHIIEITSDIVLSENTGGFSADSYGVVLTEITINGRGNTISRTEDSPDDFRFFEILDGFNFGVLNGHLILNNITLTGGKTTTTGPTIGGGAIFVNDDAELTMNNVTLSNNRSEAMSGSVLGYGGAINIEGRATITNSEIVNNYARRGGGISSFHLVGSSLTNSNDVEIFSSTISDNMATVEGGGIYAEGGDLIIDGVTLANNEVSVSGDLRGNGGGVYVEEGEFFRLRKSTISGNSASSGGGVEFAADTAEIQANTIVYNTAEDSCGGLCGGTGSVQLVHNIISGNRASFREEVTFLSPSSTTVNITGPNLIGDRGISTIQAYNNDPRFDNANIILATQNGNGFSSHFPIALDHLVAPLADNGCVLPIRPAGNTSAASCVQTHALVEGNPAIDAADDTVLYFNFDQRGVAKPAQNTNLSDLGSHEGFVDPPPDSLCVSIPVQNSITQSNPVVSFCL